MSARLLFLLAACGCVLPCAGQTVSGDAAAKRIPWTSSRIQGSPEPPRPFVAARVFPKLEFKEALELAYEPGSKRWFALERLGRIVSWPAGGDADHADLAGDLKALHPDLDNLYGIAFHPKFAENRQVFLSYTRGAGLDDGTKLSRFTMKDGRLEPDSEKVILTWRSGGHNGANLQFGPDGMLYVSTGDSEVPSPPDPRNTGQDISDLLSSILRIDVDHADPGMAYAIPKDNPFIGAQVRSPAFRPKATEPDGQKAGLQTKPARGEVWAYGLRNPWKMSFDRATGRLWCGDVGWELWEMIHLIERGGNYGWSAMEASQPVRADAPKPPTTIRPPVVAHSHDEAASITGGYAYHGRRFPELQGAYLYGDWVTGKIWALWHDGKQVARREEIADTHHKIIAFGQDAEGELVYLDYSQQGALYELRRNAADRTGKFPVKLSETGLFAKVADRKPADGVYEFHINEPMWQDGAHATHWIALPGTERIRTKVDVSEDKNGQAKAAYKTQWPRDSVLMKMLFVEYPTVRDGRPAVWTRPVETQILHFTGETWNAYSYRWNDEGTDADLVPAAGDQRELIVANDSHDPANTRRLQWRFPSRAECVRCHNAWCGTALAYHPAQMDGEGWRSTAPARGSRATSQIDLHLDLGLIDGRFAEQTVSRLVWHRASDPYNFAATDARARSYLHANCSHCHRQNAGGAVNMFLNAELLLGQTRTVGVKPAQGGLGLEDPRLIDPGNPWNSVIALRLAKSGTGHMPVIGPHEVDVVGLNLIEDWIARMGDEGLSASALLPKHWDETGVREKLATVGGAMQVLRAVDDEALKGPLRQFALETAWKSPLATVRDLFDRFIPDDRRVATIGMKPDAGKILALAGDAGRGASVLHLQGKLAVCYGCHLVNGQGRDFGPDLSRAGTRLKPEATLESILQPSKVIAQGYAAVTVELKEGDPQTGFVVREGADEVALKNATGQTVSIQRSNIAKLTRLPSSLMPDGLAQGLTAQEMADVVAYLSSLK